MKTEALVSMLARGPVAADPATTERRLGAGTAAGALAVLVIGLIAVGPRPDLASAALHPGFWLKLAFPLTLAIAAFAAACRLARPGVRLGAAGWAMLALVALVLLLAAIVLLRAPTAEAWPLVAGQSALECVAAIVALSLPAFVAAVAALRTLAPTRLAAAGAVAGLLAGAVAATVYALHCDEMAVPFVAAWYGLGMALPAALGAWLGPRVLRW
jgi:hypothetical protein